MFGLFLVLGRAVNICIWILLPDIAGSFLWVRTPGVEQLDRVVYPSQHSKELPDYFPEWLNKTFHIPTRRIGRILVFHVVVNSSYCDVASD